MKLLPGLVVVITVVPCLASYLGGIPEQLYGFSWHGNYSRRAVSSSGNRFGVRVFSNWWTFVSSMLSPSDKFVVNLPECWYRDLT